MGKGDKKTKRGKIILGTYGVRRRPKKEQQSIVSEVRQTEKVRRNEPVRAERKPEAAPAPPKKKLKTTPH